MDLPDHRRLRHGTSRRRWLGDAAALCALWTPGLLQARPAAGHGELGAVQPRRHAPALALTLHDGSSASLPGLLRGRFTALQLMFTGCSASCPVQGAIFAALQGLTGELPREAQLLSLSIDPLGDDARALAAWRERFGATARWRAAVPGVAQADVMPDFLGGRRSGVDRHSAQTWLFDRDGRLAYRLADLAPARDIARALQSLAALDARDRP